jgi:hypothetical protein
MMKDTQLLSQVGEALYGAHWQSALASEIAVSDRSMRRWANGADPIPWGVWFDVYRRLEERALTLSYWKDELYERVVIKECEQRPTEPHDLQSDWLIEVHQPLDGRHSMKHSAVVPSLAEVQAVMKKNPGMIFRVTVPLNTSAADRDAFWRIARLFPEAPQQKT